MSDLISRQAVLDELEKWDWQDLYLPIHFKQILDDVPSVENKGDFDGMTNGEVLQAIISGLEPIVLSNETGAIYFDWEWWNAPYQKGGE